MSCEEYRLSKREDDLRAFNGLWSAMSFRRPRGMDVLSERLTVLSALACSMCYDSGLHGHLGLPLQLALCRFLLGLGVGGEYPLSATVSAEAVGDASGRGQIMTLVLSMQGLGMLLASLLAMFLVTVGLSLEATWRLLLAFGSFPSAIAFCLRWHLSESEAFERCKSAEVLCERSHSQKVVTTLASCWPLLAGTSSAWLLMNMFTYSLGSFKSSIFETAQSSAADEVFQQALFAALTTLG
eukprot:g1139.t1